MLCVNNPVAVKRGQDSLGVFCFWTDASFMSDADRRRSFLAPFTACVCDRWRKQGSLMVLRSVTVWIYHQGAEKKKNDINVQLSVKINHLSGIYASL